MGPKLCCFDLICCLHLLGSHCMLASGSKQKLMIFMTQGWAFLLKGLSLVDHWTLVCLCLTSVVGLDAGTESSTTSAKLRSIFGDPDVRWIVKNRPTLQSWRAFSINTNSLTKPYSKQTIQTTGPPSQGRVRTPVAPDPARDAQCCTNTHTI